ncbi:hypothetical protein HNR07_001532 [Nocardiopsis metallicus]|uniref:Uncharacterized protein n=1 Tax=Nocardiopsis metallicus TaxID=179819 RepID=A0A840WEK6_9ACTN|nr:hypothetical protein [Nocardiopsis metallicus]
MSGTATRLFLTARTVRAHRRRSTAMSAQLTGNITYQG